jgi:alkylation response protein AidB-like acyl-CoA dehydrogenase
MASGHAGLPSGEKAGSDHLARAQALAPRLTEAGDEIERARELPPKIVDALVEGGFFRMLLPRSLGGAELDPPSYAVILEELAKADASTAWCLGQNSGCSMIAPYLDPATAREVFAPPRGILAWGPDLPGAGKGVAVEGGYAITGQWAFATGSRHASWLGAHVPIFEPDGTPRLEPNGRPFIRTVIFPKKSARIIDNWQVVGLRGTGSDSYAADGLFVPQRYTAGRDNEAERREPGPLYRFTSGMIYAASFSAVSLGIARGALDAFIILARDKIPRGAKRTLRENNVIQSQVAQCEARIGSCRAFLFATLEEMWREANRSGRLPPEQHVKMRLASTWAINQARDVVATVYNAAGAAAIFNENPFERRLRDMHAGSQQGQGRPLHFETVGQILLGLKPEGRMFR